MTCSKGATGWIRTRAAVVRTQPCTWGTRSTSLFSFQVIVLGDYVALPVMQKSTLVVDILLDPYYSYIVGCKHTIYLPNIVCLLCRYIVILLLSFLFTLYTQHLMHVCPSSSVALPEGILFLFVKRVFGGIFPYDSNV